MARLLVSFSSNFPWNMVLGLYDTDQRQFFWLKAHEVFNQGQGCTGICKAESAYWYLFHQRRAPWALCKLLPDGNTPRVIFFGDKINDAHSLVYLGEDTFLANDTATDRVFRLKVKREQPGFDLFDYWTHPDRTQKLNFADKLRYPEDLNHVNSLALHHGEVYVTCFGNRPADAKIEDGWKTASNGAVINITKNETICQGLLQPHSVTSVDDTLYWLESLTGKIYQKIGTEIKVVAQCEGYLRGITYDDLYLYIASSGRRLISKSTGQVNEVASNAAQSYIYQIDRYSHQTIARHDMTLLGREIYELQLANDIVLTDRLPGNIERIDWLTKAAYDAEKERLKKLDEEP